MDTKCTGVLWRCEGISENVDVEVEVEYAFEIKVL